MSKQQKDMTEKDFDMAMDILDTIMTKRKAGKITVTKELGTQDVIVENELDEITGMFCLFQAIAKIISGSVFMKMVDVRGFCHATIEQIFKENEEQEKEQKNADTDNK